MAKPITSAQLRCLQTLWHGRMAKAGISCETDSRELRHQFVANATAGRARATKELSFADAKRVIRMLIGDARGLTISDAATAHAAGTHRRSGYDDGSHAVLVGPQQMRLLALVQARLGWDQGRLDGFIARQLGQNRPIKTMGDFNTVIWPMKRMARAGKQVHNGAE